MERSRLLVCGDAQAVAAGIVAWARQCGSDTDDVRDAAHEASHALECGVADWDREEIHGALIGVRNGERARTEIEARAVERLVCAALGVAHNWPNFVFLCAMEAMKSGVRFPSLDMLEAAIRSAMGAPEVVERAALILAMGREYAPAVQVAA